MGIFVEAVATKTEATATASALADCMVPGVWRLLLLEYRVRCSAMATSRASSACNCCAAIGIDVARGRGLLKDQVVLLSVSMSVSMACSAARLHLCLVVCSRIS